MKREDGFLSNFSWKLAERILTQLVSFVVSIILARILDPSYYGVISMVNIFILLANIFVTDGFGSALIQKKDADALDFSSVLYFNIIFSILLYFILYISAPFIADFYGEGYEILVPVLRVLGVRIILSGINSVQQAFISKKMIFRKSFWASLIGTILSAVVGIAMALLGYGIWSLVTQYLINTIVNTFVLGILIGEIPPLKFSYNRLSKMFEYGIGILITSFLITGFTELRALITGKIYSAKDLAYYDMGRKIPNLLVVNINTSLSTVLFPKMSKEQDDKNKIKTTTRNSIRFSSYLLCPIMLGLASVSESLVKIVLTEKWVSAVPLMQLFCIVYLFQPIHSANMQAIKAFGRVDIYAKLEIFKKTIEIIVLLFVMRISVEAIVISMAILTTLFTFVNAYPNKKILGYNFKEQMKDILPSIGMSAIMVVFVNLIGLIPMATLPLLIIQIISGILLYITISVVTKNKELKIILSIAKAKIQHR